MAKKPGNNPNVKITARGVIYVDANELFKSPKVRKFIHEMAEIEKKYRSVHTSSEDFSVKSDTR